MKICGIKDSETALKAADSGADFIGLVFADKSPRKVTVGEAKSIVNAIASSRDRQVAFSKG